MKKLLILCALVGLSFPLIAKNPVKGVPKECKASKPFYVTQKNKVEVLMYFAEKGYGQSAPVQPLEYWDAYSDRDDNTTYLSNSTSKPYSSLGFREKVRIARIRNEFALVYTPGDESSDVYPSIPKDVEWKGWIPLANLVYYDWARTNTEGLFQHVLLKDNVIFSSRLKLASRLFEHPSDRGEGIELPNKSNSLFYMVKKVGSFILLATRPDLSRPENIYGWISDRDAMLWDSRMAFEPTWDLTNFSFFAENGDSNRLLDVDGVPIGTISYGLPASGKLVSADQLRMHDGSWRIPVLRPLSEDAYECAISGQSAFLEEPSRKVPVVSSGDSQSEEAAPWVNICFVVDGSRVYEPFFPILAERIQALGAGESGSNIRVGMTIYHDARNSSFMTESCSLTEPGSAELFDFIDQGGTYGFKDNLSEAPLLAALKEAYDRAGFFDGANNIIVVIGGRGDSSDYELSPAELGEMFADSNISVYGMQVQNSPNVAAYRSFGYLMEEIVRSNVNRRMGESVLTERELVPGSPVEIASFRPKGSAVDVHESIATCRDGLMPEDVFSEELERILQRIGESVSAWDAVSSAYPEFFRRVKIWSSDGQRDYFKQVALFSQTEFEDLLSFFKSLNEESLKKVPDRENVMSFFQSVYLSIFRYQDDMKETDPSSVRNMGCYQLISRIAGLRMNKSFYAGRTLKDIGNEKAVSLEELRFILSGLSAHYYRLLEIQETPSVYRTIINGASYYWVPVEDIL